MTLPTNQHYHKYDASNEMSYSSRKENISTMIPFLAYRILPTQTIVRNNIHFGHVKEDIEALLLTLSPILYIFHRDIPKPHILHPNIIQNLSIKPGTLALLPILGWTLNEKDEYWYVPTDIPHEMAHRQNAAREFRKFYNELATAKDRSPIDIERFLQIRITVPFSSYSIFPAQTLIHENIHLDHVKEDMESLAGLLVPLLHISKPEFPKPPILHLFIIQHLAAKPGLVELLKMFGYAVGFKKESVWIPPASAQDIALQEKIADEFRRFYEELKKRKNEPPAIMEYFLSHWGSEITSKSLHY